MADGKRVSRLMIGRVRVRHTAAMVAPDPAEAPILPC
jgi:hypothetical protein